MTRDHSINQAASLSVIDGKVAIGIILLQCTLLVFATGLNLVPHEDLIS